MTSITRTRLMQAIGLVLLVVGLIIFRPRQTTSRYVYFLQKSGERVNVVGTKVDGSGFKVVLAGTGEEEKKSQDYPSDTDYGDSLALLASKDWRYLVLRANRDGGRTKPKLYCIDTKTSELKTIDDSSSLFEFIGWQGDRFLYRTTSLSQQKATAEIKAYVPAKGTMETLDTTSGYEMLSAAYLIEHDLVYAKFRNDNPAFFMVLPGATTPEKISDFRNGDVENPGMITTNIYHPDDLYFSYYSNPGSGSFVYRKGAITEASDQDANHQDYHVYVASPSERQTAWFETAGETNTIYIGDAQGNNAKVIAQLPKDHMIFGWQGERTLIIQSADQLYSMNTVGGGRTPLGNFMLGNKGYNTAMAGYPGAGYGYGGTF